MEDLFDILDVSLREDTYTSLIAHVLRTDQRLAASVFTILVSRASRDFSFRPEHVAIHFRHTLASFCGVKGAATGKDKPDLLLIGQRGDQRWWVVIEAKVTAGEGPQQLRRYREVCEHERAANGIAGFCLFFLTLGGGTGSDQAFRTISHGELATMIEQQRDQRQSLPTPLELAWDSYRDRLDQMHDVVPDDSICVADSLTRTATGFITTDARCYGLAQRIAPGGFDVRGGLFPNRGRASCVMLLSRPAWRGAHEFHPNGLHRLEACFDIHLEVEIVCRPQYQERAVCHLHYETRPYMPESKLRSAAEAERLAAHHQRRETFRRHVHARLKEQSARVWRPRNGKLQIASCPLVVSEQATVGELREMVAPRIAQIASIVDEIISDMKIGR